MNKLCLLIIALSLSLTISSAEDITKGTDTLRAIYLYKIGLYVSSRAEKNAIKIGVVGEDSIIRLLNSLKGQKGFKHRYDVFEFDRIEEYKAMHVVYLPGRYYDKRAIETLLTQKTIIVGNEEFCWVREYHICLFQKENKLKFKANISQMRQTGVEVSSKLLRLSVETK